MSEVMITLLNRSLAVFHTKYGPIPAGQTKSLPYLEAEKLLNFYPEIFMDVNSKTTSEQISPVVQENKDLKNTVALLQQQIADLQKKEQSVAQALTQGTTKGK
jgi:hypothetical protein